VFVGGKPAVVKIERVKGSARDRAELARAGSEEVPECQARDVGLRLPRPPPKFHGAPDFGAPRICVGSGERRELLPTQEVRELGVEDPELLARALNHRQAVFRPAALSRREIAPDPVDVALEPDQAAGEQTEAPELAHKGELGTGPVSATLMLGSIWRLSYPPRPSTERLATDGANPRGFGRGVAGLDLGHRQAYTIRVFSYNHSGAVVSDATPARHAVVVPHRELSGEALDRLIAEFVCRDGTDYGEREALLEHKMDEVRQQLEHGEVVIMFDLETESANLIPAEFAE
jgi:uncharacterized protein